MKTIRSSAPVIAPVILAFILVACGKDLNTKTISFGQTGVKRVDTRPVVKEPTVEALFASKYSSVTIECNYFLKRTTDSVVSTKKEYTNIFEVYPVTKEEKVTKVVSEKSDYDAQLKYQFELGVDQEINHSDVSYHPTVTVSGELLMTLKSTPTQFIKADLNETKVDLDMTPAKEFTLAEDSLDDHEAGVENTFKTVCHLNLTPLATTVK